MKTRSENILSLLKLRTSHQSVDFVNNKKQFHLHSLLTEQRHPKTWNLSLVMKNNAKQGIKQIFSVDEDISIKFSELSNDLFSLSQASQAVFRALKEKKRFSSKAAELRED